jgi:hypothetical protein
MIDRKTILKRTGNLAMAIAALLFLELYFDVRRGRQISRAAFLWILWLPAMVAWSFPELGKWRWLLFTVTGLCVAGDLVYIILGHS